MSASVDSQAYYKKRLDKFKSRSTRIFNRAQNLNRTLDRQLDSVVKSLATNRDVNIRRDQEKIWMVTGATLHAPKYSNAKDDVPTYLQGKQANATLPTPQELSSLLPNKKAKERTQSAGNYMQLSRRRLSSMKSVDLNIIHYRKALDKMREKEITPLYREIIPENEAEDQVDGDFGGGGVEQWATQQDRLQSTNTPSIRPNTAIPASSSSRPDQPERPKTSIPDAARRKRRESVPNAAALMIEQAQDPNNKVLRTNFLDMYKTQMAKHQRRMSAIKEKRAPRATSTKVEATDQNSRPRTAGPTIAEEGEEDDRSHSPGFMADTSASNMRRSLRQRLRRTSMAAVAGMNTLHGEVKRFQSFRKFKKESLNVLENDIPNIEDLEEGELFDEMRKCRYIRFGEDEERIAKLNEDQPLVNHLKRLSIDTTKKPKRFLKKLNEQNEPGT